MTNGRHVTAAECRSMREDYERGYFVWMIAAEHDLSKDAADYHIYGRCTHPDG